MFHGEIVGKSVGKSVRNYGGDTPIVGRQPRIVVIRSWEGDGGRCPP
jgi:hypothetical protein